MANLDISHAGLMDDVYRTQRRFYDVTRKYYLLGRDRIIHEMNPAENAHILEIACGTGRNLHHINRHYPGRALYGLDISEQMLASARKKLAGRAYLKQGDACHFDPKTMFGRKDFDHIVMSYSLSMIPDWQSALNEAISHLAPGGTLHIVDFGTQSGLPEVFKRALHYWLREFHVSPREDMEQVLAQIAEEKDMTVNFTPLYRGYAQMARVRG